MLYFISVRKYNSANLYHKAIQHHIYTFDTMVLDDISLNSLIQELDEFAQLAQIKYPKNKRITIETTNFPDKKVFDFQQSAVLFATRIKQTRFVSGQLNKVIKTILWKSFNTYSLIILKAWPFQKVRLFFAPNRHFSGVISLLSFPIFIYY